MAPGILQDPAAESQPAKRIKLDMANVQLDDDDVAAAVPPHPLGIKPAGNAYTATHNIKERCGSFARLPDELLNHVLESFDADALVRLGSTCRTLYAFTRLDELWRALFVANPPPNFTWRGTWRATYLSTPQEHTTSIQCDNLFSDVLYRPFQCAHANLEPYTRNIPLSNAIPRLPDLTHAEFTQSWTSQPFILTDPVKNWPIYKTWTPTTLLRQFPSTPFTAEAVDWPLETYISYMNNNTDESPLYLFDRAFTTKTHIDPLHHPESSYSSPHAFGPDLFAHLGPHRPDSRWLILGPARSGSTFHKDPNATSAWNAVLTGRKYWLMFPSGPTVAPPPGIILSADHAEITAPLSIAEYLLTFHALARATPGCREAICHAGEVLHVPSGWFHLVLNLDESLAVTQNFVPRGKLADVLAFLRDQRDQVSGFKDERVAERAYEVFVERLEEEEPEVLGEAMRELERREEVRGRWERVKSGEGEGGFSFGFGGDESDADVP